MDLPGSGPFAWCQLTFEVVDEFEMKVEEPTEEAEDEQQVLGP